jgi:hypothetical protein
MALLPAGIAARLLLQQRAYAPEQEINGGVVDPAQPQMQPATIGRQTREALLNDPEYLRAQEQIDIGSTPHAYGKSAGAVGAFAQGMQEYVGKRDAKAIEGRYQQEEARRREALAKALGGYMAPGGGTGGGGQQMSFGGYQTPDGRSLGGGNVTLGVGGGSPAEISAALEREYQADQNGRQLSPQDRELLALALDTEGGGDAMLGKMIEQRFARPAGPEFKEVGGAVVRINPDGTVTEAYRAPKEDKPPSDWDMYERAMGQLPPEQQVDFLTYKKMLANAGASRVSNTTNINPQKDDQFGEPPKDMVWARGEDGGLMMQEVPGMPGVRRPVAVPIVGSPPDVKGVEGGQKAAERAAGTKRQGNIVLDNVKKAKDAAGFWTTGFVGSKLADIPGTPAYDLNQTLQTIKANIGFDRLQQMRDNSETGAALGSVTEVETKLLQSVLAAVEQSQSEGQFLENMDALEREYNRIVNGSDRQSGGTPAAPRVIRYDANGNRIQ